MEYFLDTEFIEAGYEKNIEVISLALVAGDGREYYAQCAEFLQYGAPTPTWIKENVLPSLGNIWTTRETIKRELLAFLDSEKYGTPELWGYYSAYDHVVFCQFFGAMIDLPSGYPMLTYDLRQWLDMNGFKNVHQPDGSPHNALEDARWIAKTHTRLVKKRRQEEWAFDDDYEDWKIGDTIIWEQERDKNPIPMTITFLDEHERVFWREDEKEVLTRMTNMLRRRKAKTDEEG